MYLITLPQTSTKKCEGNIIQLKTIDSSFIILRCVSSSKSKNRVRYIEAAIGGVL